MMTPDTVGRPMICKWRVGERALLARLADPIPSDFRPTPGTVVQVRVKFARTDLAEFHVRLRFDLPLFDHVPDDDPIKKLVRSLGFETWELDVPECFLEPLCRRFEKQE